MLERFQTRDRSGNHPWLAMMVLLPCFVLSACGDSSSSSSPVEDGDEQEQEDTDNEEEQGLGQDEIPDAGEIGEVGELSGPTRDVPADLVDQERIGLTIDSSARCSLVGQSFDMAVTRSLTVEEQAAGDLDSPQDVSAYVTLTQSLGNSLELLSRGDGAIQLQHRQQDVVGLTAELGTGSVTAYLAGFAPDAPTSVVLRKPVPGGCLYALRLPDYCATGIAKAGNFTIGVGDQAISAQGCELSNPAAHPVIELAAPEQ
ncbi:hypothetical protein ACUNV4_12670 [Granulosicoccus sp. 3-233]|uniref:hypothetical protein n=1 Tax=Granulosicoccus sp. 3-233 TaxID=3417969 RepID=UPI003D343E2C